MNIVLTGMKHCGKSTAGSALASRWQCPFYDVDPMIEATYTCDTNDKLSIREILSTCGQERFNQLESMVVSELYLKLDQPGATNIVALGGRTALNQTIRDLLGGIGLIVYLRLTPEELLSRVQRVGLPPFLDQQDPAADFLNLCRRRDPRYQRLADVVVDLDALDVDQATTRLEERIEEHTHAGQ